MTELLKKHIEQLLFCIMSIANNARPFSRSVRNTRSGSLVQSYTGLRSMCNSRIALLRLLPSMITTGIPSCNLNTSFALGCVSIRAVEFLCSGKSNGLIVMVILPVHSTYPNCWKQVLVQFLCDPSILRMRFCKVFI